MKEGKINLQNQANEHGLKQKQTDSLPPANSKEAINPSGKSDQNINKTRSVPTQGKGVVKGDDKKRRKNSEKASRKQSNNRRNIRQHQQEDLLEDGMPPIDSATNE